MRRNFEDVLPDVEPPHPGDFVQLDILEAYGLTQEELAQRLEVSRKTISELVNKHRALSMDMALRLARYTETSVELWINLQAMHDLWVAKHSKNAARIENLRTASSYGERIIASVSD